MFKVSFFSMIFCLGFSVSLLAASRSLSVEDQKELSKWFFESVGRGDREIVQALLHDDKSGLNINSTDEFGLTPLRRSLCAEQFEIFQWLLEEEGADIQELHKDKSLLKSFLQRKKQSPFVPYIVNRADLFDLEVPSHVVAPSEVGGLLQGASKSFKPIKGALLLISKKFPLKEGRQEDSKEKTEKALATKLYLNVCGYLDKSCSPCQRWMDGEILEKIFGSLSIKEDESKLIRFYLNHMVMVICNRKKGVCLQLCRAGRSESRFFSFTLKHKEHLKEALREENFFCVINYLRNWLKANLTEEELRGVDTCRAAFLMTASIREKLKTHLHYKKRKYTLPSRKIRGV